MTAERLTLQQALATKRGAATAAGFTSLIGYFSAISTGWGIGRVVDGYGWNAGFVSIIAASVLGTVFFLAASSAKPHGYDEGTPAD